MMSRVLLVLLAILCLRNASAGDPDENGQRSKEPVAEKLIGSDTESRFLAPEALEGLGRLFMLSGELASCYTCSVSFPMHAQSCCSSGYTSCCLNGNFFGFSYGGYGYRGERYGYNRPGTCPVAAPNFPQTCTNQCFYDSDCPGEYKCCSFGCSFICSRPLFPGSILELEKPGVCSPVISYGFSSGYYGNSFGGFGYGGSGFHSYGASGGPLVPPIDNSIHDCLTDADCPGSQKCCTRAGLQRVCTFPSFPSYGR